jgi:hypothetical protein
MSDDWGKPLPEEHFKVEEKPDEEFVDPQLVIAKCFMRLVELFEEQNEILREKVAVTSGL